MKSPLGMAHFQVRTVCCKGCTQIQLYFKFTPTEVDRQRQRHEVTTNFGVVVFQPVPVLKHNT